MNIYTTARVLLALLFFGSILFGQWWMPMLLGLALLIFFAAPEVLVGAVMMDFLYASPYALMHLPAFWTTLAILCFFTFRFLHSRLF